MKNMMLAVSAICVLAGCALNDNNAAAVRRAQPLDDHLLNIEGDKRMVANGFLPAAVIEIDEEMEKVPVNSPKYLQLMQKKLRVTQEYGRVAEERLRKAQAERAKYPPTQVRPQPVEDGQRMCSVNNGSATYLVPC
ncbi:hypothetical protein IAE35_22945 [Pseudomonas sp. S75]|uniref:hypothetical protein n=1 Tax=unclassified Pseudomonas TaxID=196821 RepID=UPI001903856E|nr:MULTISPECIES: hypothetical protein [unclassified Pseudomonas]MBJ9977212.1 hypothetical protein [Pseudomonas sp. S30]MBK0156209.1 hypothetical protein [Pseudomonas sp. S75]